MQSLCDEIAITEQGVVHKSDGALVEIFKGKELHSVAFNTPDEIKKIILDGIVNQWKIEWANGYIIHGTALTNQNTCDLPEKDQQVHVFYTAVQYAEKD